MKNEQNFKEMWDMTKCSTEILARESQQVKNLTSQKNKARRQKIIYSKCSKKLLTKKAICSANLSFLEKQIKDTPR